MTETFTVEEVELAKWLDETPFNKSIREYTINNKLDNNEANFDYIRYCFLARDLIKKQKENERRFNASKWNDFEIWLNSNIDYLCLNEHSMYSIKKKVFAILKSQSDFSSHVDAVQQSAGENNDAESNTIKKLKEELAEGIYEIAREYASREYGEIEEPKTYDYLNKEIDKFLGWKLKSHFLRDYAIPKEAFVATENESKVASFHGDNRQVPPTEYNQKCELKVGAVATEADKSVATPNLSETVQMQKMDVSARDQPHHGSVVKTNNDHSLSNEGADSIIKQLGDLEKRMYELNATLSLVHIAKKERMTTSRATFVNLQIGEWIKRLRSIKEELEG